MALVLQPHVGGALDDFQVVHGGMQVGRICKRQTALSRETEWLWAFNGVLNSNEDIRLTGLAGTRDEAKNAVQQSWDKWLMWAQLSETGLPPEVPHASTRPPTVKVVGVQISSEPLASSVATDKSSQLTNLVPISDANRLNLLVTLEPK